MSDTIRFGRKIPMPSTVEIKHDLRLMEAAEAIVAGTVEERGAVIDDLAAEHGVSRDQATKLVERLGAGQGLDDAARGLRAGKASISDRA